MTCQCVISGSYTVDGVPQPITDYVITSQIRDAANTVVSNLTVTVTDADAGLFQLQGDTTAWPADQLYWDVKIVDENGVVYYSETTVITIVEAVTNAV